MFTKSRVALAAALAASALGSTQALATPLDSTGPSRGTEAPPASDLRSADAREGDVTSPGSDLRTADARESGGVKSPATASSGQAVQPVVVETTAPAAAGFDWTAAVIGAAGGLALAVLCGTGIALARRRPVRPTTA